MPNKFTQTENKVLTFESNSFKGTITHGTYTWTASLQWKSGYKPGPGVITAISEESLRANLKQLDASVTFYVNASGAPLVSADEVALEQMRVDPAVSDEAYRNACRGFKQTPKARPDFNAAAQAATTLSHRLPTFAEQNEARMNFNRTHPEIMSGPHATFNASLIDRFLFDENLPSTFSTLNKACEELSLGEMFRDNTSGTRGGRIVKPYDIDVLRRIRRRNDAPAPVRRTAAEHQRERNDEKLSLVARARQAVLAEYPELTPQPGSGESGELRKLIDAQLLEWARQENPRMQSTNYKRAEDLRIFRN